MRIPTISGLIDRRVLVNYRVDPQVLSGLLPEPFRPQLVNGFGIAGICLIRLRQIRPRLLPAVLGVSSENAAHRIAVEWDAGNETRTGVFIPRRDTSSRFHAIAGGRLFPGIHNFARFDVRETDDRFHIAMTSADRTARVVVDGRTSASLPPDSIFQSVAEASRFFEAGSLGYSPRKTPGEYDGLELRTLDWRVESLVISHVESSFFDDRAAFPNGSATFDNALLMRNISHEWHSRETLRNDDSAHHPNRNRQRSDIA